MKDPQDTRAEDVRIGDVWHMSSPEGCDGPEEHPVLDVRRELWGDGPRVLITFDNGIDSPAVFDPRQWVLVHRGEA